MNHSMVCPTLISGVFSTKDDESSADSKVEFEPNPNHTRNSCLEAAINPLGSLQ